MGTLTSSLIVSLIDKVSGPARAAAASLKGIGAAARGIGGGPSLSGMTAGLNAAIEKNARQMDAMRGKMVDAAAAGFALSRALQAPLRAAMDFESAMADVKKVVDFETPAAFKAFQQDVLTMSTRIPMAAKSLSEIVAAAGQSGIDRGDLLAFTEMAAKVGVAFDISAGQAGEALAKLKTGLGLTIPQTGKMADAMNHLSNAMASSAPDILDVVRRVGATAKQYGFNEIQVSAFASAMLSAGAESDVAATSFRNMGKALTKGASATKSQRGAFAALRLDARKVAKAMQKDAVGTTIDVLERIGKLPAHMRASISSDLFGDEARALGPLLTNLPLLKQALALVAREAEYAGSANKEYAVRAETFANAVQLMRNRMERLGIAIGTILIPPLSDLMARMTPLVDGVRAFAEAHPVLVKNVTLATAALISFRVAAIAARWAGLFAFGGLLKGAAGLVQVAGAAAVAAGSLSRLSSGIRAAAIFLATPFTAFARHVKGVFQIAVLRYSMMMSAFRAGSIGIGGILAGVGATGARGLLQLLNPIRLVTGALVGLKVAVRGLMIGTGIGAVIVGLGLAAEWAANNWDNLKKAFAAFTDEFSKGIEPLRKDDMFGPVVRSIGDVITAMRGLTTEGNPAAFAAAGASAGRTVAGAFVTVANAIRDVAGLFATIEEKWAAFNKWDLEITGRIVEGAKSAWAGFESWWSSAIASFQSSVSQLPGKLYDAGTSAVSRAGDAFAALPAQLYDAGASAVASMVEGLRSKAAELTSWATSIDMSSIVERFSALPGQIVGALAGLPAHLASAGSQAIQGLLDGMVAKFGELLAWVKGIPGRIVAAIGKVDLGNIVKWPSMPSFFGGSKAPEKPAGGPSSAPATSPAPGKQSATETPQRFAWLPKLPPMLSMQAPEPIRVASADAPGASPVTVINRAERQPIFSGKAPEPAKPQRPNVNMGGYNVTMNVTGITDPKELADKVTFHLEKRFREDVHGIYADYGLEIA